MVWGMMIAQDQPWPRLLLDHRLWPVRTACLARRLRLSRPGHGWPDVGHRREGWTPGAGPQKVGVAVTDLLTGLYTTIGALSGLARKDRTGEGCHVDCSILDVTVASMADQALSYLVSGNVPKRMGNDHSMIVPSSRAFATADDSIIIAVGNDGQLLTHGRGDRTR